jgi:hypothetical protein
MSFRRYGGMNYSARNNIVKNNYSNSNILSVMDHVGQPNSMINFDSDISGNTIYGDLNVSGNITIDISGNGIYFPDNSFQTTAATSTDSYWVQNTNNSIYYNSGYVGIGTSNPSYTLDVSGNANITGACTAASFSTPSDYRIKDNVKLLDSSFNVDNLKPVTYLNKLSLKQDIGLIAHELQENYPYLVTGIKDGLENQSVNYIGLIPVLIKEIQDLKKEMLELKQDLKQDLK